VIHEIDSVLMPPSVAALPPLRGGARYERF